MSLLSDQSRAEHPGFIFVGDHPATDFANTLAMSQGQWVTHLPGQLTPPRLRGAARQLVGADDLKAAGGFPARQLTAVRTQVTEQALCWLGRVDSTRRGIRLGGYRRHAGHELLLHTAQPTPPSSGPGRAEGLGHAGCQA